MASDLNMCCFIGRLGKDPELRYLPDGKAVVSISIAVGETWKAKDSGEKQEKTTWVPIVAFGKLAEIIGEYLKKGAKVYVSGRLQVRKWQDKEGNDRYTTEIIANQMQMLDTRNSGVGQEHGGGRGSAQQQSGGGWPSGESVSEHDFDDPIPF